MTKRKRKPADKEENKKKTCWQREETKNKPPDKEKKKTYGQRAEKKKT